MALAEEAGRFLCTTEFSMKPETDAQLIPFDKHSKMTLN
jgi:hypothetical protein